MEITCPSGLRGVIRGMKGREAQAFVDPALVRTHGSMDTMLSNCWLETSDPGPYELVAPKMGKDLAPRIQWRGVLLGDRFHALMEIRALTFGQDYDFNVKCENCEQRYGWELPLSGLERKPLPVASFEKIKANANRFEVDLPDGKVLAFKLSTGEEEVQIAKIKGGAQSTKKLGPVDAVMVQALGVYVRVHGGGADIANVHASVGVTEFGEEVKPIPGGPVGVRRYLEDLDYADLLDLVKVMQDHDCGVETKIETVCEHCQWQQWIELPFQRSFFERRAKKPAA